tara:strand:+ start:92 stop:301 length:210 start_codon:yes stop_codon:yes gene_type:complete
MKVVKVYGWVLVLVIAHSPVSYGVEPLAFSDTMAECYFHSTVIDLDDEMQFNSEMLCIRVEGEEWLDLQ